MRLFAGIAFIVTSLVCLAQIPKSGPKQPNEQWVSMFNGKDEYEALIRSIEDVAKKWHARDGKLVMTKVVGGILATK